MLSIASPRGRTQNQKKKIQEEKKFKKKNTKKNKIVFSFFNEVASSLFFLAD
jgi:hypothetical protein